MAQLGRDIRVTTLVSRRYCSCCTHDKQRLLAELHLKAVFTVEVIRVIEHGYERVQAEAKNLCG